jgi:hypothetical protein
MSFNKLWPICHGELDRIFPLLREIGRCSHMVNLMWLILLFIMIGIGSYSCSPSSGTDLCFIVFGYRFTLGLRTGKFFFIVNRESLLRFPRSKAQAESRSTANWWQSFE